jgi:hypothetical protein
VSRPETYWTTVNTAEAMPDGDLVHVDGAAGSIEIVERANQPTGVMR